MVDEPNKTPPQNQQRPAGGSAPPPARGGKPADKKTELPEGLLPKGKSADDYKPENYDPESDLPEGDATKGKPDFQKRAESVIDSEAIAMRDHRAYLISQAEKNERVNDEAQAQAIEAVKEKAPVIGLLNDPDFQRDKSVEQAQIEADMRSPEYVEKWKKAREEAEKKAAKVA